ncbi:hypothetical protein [Glycomyces terrestris]|uniref:DUF3153 domain-containing protein n=1 Tax=Glycomyces terrestris TaxID=2493553 RepID=A0A426V4B1_9ACTN|nr:hypothetical protein [Glycomyces terrestris]RRS01759.1 hypothetical protein EIW28_03095 [Glycomyces terrestris]
MRTALSAAAAAALLLTAACGAEESPPNIAGEYVESNDVKNDVYPTASTAEDRMANLASMGPPEQIIGSLFFPAPCAETDIEECSPGTDAYEAIEDFAGSDPEFFMRFLLVRYEDTSLELMPVYVARDGDGETALIDIEGGRYEDLDDFRQSNDLFGSGDWIMTAKDITDVEADIDVVTVTGRTAPAWMPWLVGAGAAAVLALAAAILVRKLRHRAGPE